MLETVINNLLNDYLKLRKTTEKKKTTEKAKRRSIRVVLIKKRERTQEVSDDLEITSNEDFTNSNGVQPHHVLRGPKGPKGPKEPKEPKGSKGPKGPKRPKGPKGPKN
ncbi:hypothetical protein Glove_165g66 [Diversispora epigaea]|uniref:Uncharacterized protein n=1 Tax=Diversispora epigaea TaxID=1348612 RepID=A0A397J0H0_9GLOM|nr:hypothetical protein Glove_165g66 [Diversispora epigaea]